MSVQIAIDHFKTRNNLAKALGVTPMAVHQWTKRGIPAERAAEIVAITDGVLSLEQLRPDLFITDN